MLPDKTKGSFPQCQFLATPLFWRPSAEGLRRVNRVVPGFSRFHVAKIMNKLIRGCFHHEIKLIMWLQMSLYESHIRMLVIMTYFYIVIIFTSSHIRWSVQYLSHPYQLPFGLCCKSVCSNLKTGCFAWRQPVLGMFLLWGVHHHLGVLICHTEALSFVNRGKHQAGENYGSSYTPWLRARV